MVAHRSVAHRSVAHWSVVAAALLGFLAPPLGAQIFGPPVQFPASAFPRASTACDMNGDGAPDLLLGSFLDASVAVLPGNGDGTFGAVKMLVASGVPAGFAPADLSLDGRLDVVYAITGSIQFPGKLVKRVANGSGGYGPEQLLVQLGVTYSIAVADLTGDSLADVAVLANNPPGIQVAKASPGGTFTLGPLSPSPASPQVMTLGDLNFDGNLDAVVGHATTGLVSVFLGNGAGGFGAATSFPAAGDHRTVVIDDVDGDFLPDVATTSDAITSSLMILKGDGLGSLGSPQSIPLPGATMNLAESDFDQNGIRDFVIVHPNPSMASVLLGLGGGSFAPPISLTPLSTPFGASAADFDSEGLVDLTITNAAVGTITFFHNILAVPPGVSSFGSGTAGCHGTLAVSLGSNPQIGNLGFGYACTNAPASSLGFVLCGNVADPGGADPFGLGLVCHVSLLFSTYVAVHDVTTNAGGVGFAPSPIPNTPFLVGSSFTAQAIFVENGKNGLGCSPAVVHLVSSKGLTLIVQP